jgi:hypothetical protein
MLPRQLRVRVLEALERRARQFRTREDLYPCRVPREPVPLADVIEEALPDDHQRFDPLKLKTRTLLHLAWEDGSTWEVWVLVLPSGLKLFCDAGGEESYILASGGRHAGTETDRQFLELLADSAGQHFGIEMSGGAPSRVRSSITDREFLVDVFVDLFEVSGTEDSVRQFLSEQDHRRPSDPADTADGTDFRSDVLVWLEHVLRVTP